MDPSQISFGDRIMAKRISQEEFDQLMAAATAAHLRDIEETASGDSEKLSRANNERRRTEKSATESFGQRSGLYQFVDSIPLIGKPIAIILDYIKKGIAEHGLVMGLGRGLLVGVVIAVMLGVVSEAVPFFYDLGRNWLNLHWGAQLKTTQLANAMAELNAKGEQRLVHRGHSVDGNQVRCYPVDETRYPARLAEGDNVSIADLERRDRNLFNTSRRLNPGERVSPFFRHVAASNSRLLGLNITVPFTFKAAHYDVATLADSRTGAEYVLAAIGDQLVLISASDYRAVGLPVLEDAVTPLPQAVAAHPASSSAHAASGRGAKAISSSVGSSPSAVANATPHEPSRDMLVPVTRSSDVLFAQMTESQYQRTARDSNNILPGIRNMTVYLGEDAGPYKESLPQGTRYTPYLRNRNDPGSFVTVESFDGKLAGVLVTVENLDGSNKRRGMISKREYESYLKSAGQ
jgi:hypothetical protein